MNNNKSNIKGQLKISKGYRLKESTHRKIRSIQIALNINQDGVISKALKLLGMELKNNKKLQ